jgi:hypothetical protein
VSRGREIVPCSRGCSGPWITCRPNLIATPWQIWEKEETHEYIEPDYFESEEDTEEREEEQVWIERGVIIKEQ